MTGPDHYRAAEALLDLAETEPEASTLTPYYVAAAQVHATLALAAATVEAAGTESGNRLAIRPFPGDQIDPPYPGNDWGQALYGEATS